MNAFPLAFLNQTQAQLGDEFPAFLRALDAPAALALRLNPRRANAEAAAAPYIDGAVPWEANGRYLLPGAKPGATIAHAAGAFYVQEASAMAAVAALSPRPGEVILDLCAAPGGKSTQIAAAMGGRGALVSNDPEPSRARALAGNLERMGAGGALVVSAAPEKLAARWPAAFDAILVDAPCSGEGMFRRDPAARSEWTPAAPQGCAKRQAAILDAAARMLKPGGRLVYSTCTFNNTENEGSVAGFLARHADFAPEDFALPGVGTSQGGMLRLWPHRLRGDGHFTARLRKGGVWAPASAAATRNAPEIDRLLGELRREVCALPEEILAMRFFTQGEWLFAAPAEAPAPDGLRAVSPGLCVLRAGKNRVEPAHALAMALPPEAALRAAELDTAQAAAWLRGEAIPWDGARGWTLALHAGMPLGWGKASDGWLKNHLPKGLRLAHVSG